MKKMTLALLALFALGALAAPALAASRNDFKVIQNAVKKAPDAGPAQECRWFKVLIQDPKSGEASLKITLPVALIEIILDSADSRHFKIDEDHCDIDVKAVWAALKKAGPLALVEIKDDDGAIIKVWLE